VLLPPFAPAGSPIFINLFLKSLVELVPSQTTHPCGIVATVPNHNPIIPFAFNPDAPFFIACKIA
jgi:hypothetical protein